MRKTYFRYISFFLSVIIALGSLSSCIRTVGSLKIRGKVIDESSGSGVPCKNILIQGLVYRNDKMEPIEAGRFSTDSSGSFQYTLRRIRDAYNYNFCFMGTTEYPLTIKEIGLTNLKWNAKYLTFQLSKLTDLTIKLSRKSRAPACDTLRLVWESNGVYGALLYPYKIYNYGREKTTFGPQTEMDLVWIGGDVNSTVDTKVFAEKKTTLTWELYRYGKRNLFTDTITCKRDLPNIVFFTY